MSKAFLLAGLRLGWITGPIDLIRAVSLHRDYNTISVSRLDDYLATIALEHQVAARCVDQRASCVLWVALSRLDSITGIPLDEDTPDQQG